MPVTLGSRAFDVLAMLVERAGEVVPKQAMIDQVWGRITVTENVLQVHVSSLRRALAEHDPGPHILTDHARGYRFVTPVQQETVEAARPPAGYASPRPATRLIGRDAELALTVQMARSHRLVTLTGPGGVGKTRLAMAACETLARDLAEGAVFVDLSALNETRFVLPTVAAGFGVSISKNDDVAALCHAIGDRQTLLLLDNCDHLIERAALLAGHLLNHARDIRILATSREALGCDGEHVHRVQSLASGARGGAHGPALTLLAERARAADSRFALSEADAPIGAEICERLDGLPLAIELVAGWLPSLGFANTAARLPSLTREASEAAQRPPRQHSIMATIAWSHERLPPAEREVLGALASFAGWFPLSAAEAVAASPTAPEADIAIHVARLVNTSFLQVETGGARVRYRLLETTRGFVLAQAVGAGTARRRHAAYVRAQLAIWNDAWDLETSPVLEAAFGDLLGDTRAALAAMPRDDPAAAADIASLSWPLWVMLGLRAEGFNWIERALESRTPDDPSQAGGLWLGRAVLSGSRAIEHALADYGLAAEAFRQCGDQTRLAVALIKKGDLLASFERVAEAAAAAAEARGVVPARSRRARALLRGLDVKIHAVNGDMEQARAAFEESLALWRLCGSERDELRLLAGLSDIYWNLGDLDGAVALSREAAARARNPRFRPISVIIGGNLAGMLIERGDLEEAWSIVGDALASCVAEKYFSWLLDHVSLLHVKSGLIESAARLLGFADASSADGLPRQPNELRASNAVRAFLATALDADRMSLLLLAGAGMTDAEAIAEAGGGRW